MHQIKRRTAPWPYRGRLHPVLAGVALCVFLLAGCATPEPPSEGVASYSALMRVAASTAKAGDTGAAVALYRHAHQLKPDQPEPLIAIGQILDHARAFTGAGNAFEAALKLAPRNAEALRGLGNTLVFLDHPRAAIGKFKAALAIQPKATDVFNDYGVALDMLGRHKAAQAKYRQGLALAPGDLGLTTNLGLSLALSGHYQQALRYLRPLAGNSESTPRMREDLALVYGLTGNNNAAAQVSGIDLDHETVEDNLSYYKALRRWVDRFRDEHPSRSVPVLGSSRPTAISEAPLKAKAGAASTAASPPLMAGPVTTLPAAPTTPSQATVTPARVHKAKAATTKPAPPPERLAVSPPKAAKPAPAPVKKVLTKTAALPASAPPAAKETTKTAIKPASGAPQPLIGAATKPALTSADKAHKTAARASQTERQKGREALMKATAKTATAEAKPAPGATALGVGHNEKSPATARVQLGSYKTIPVAAASWQALVGHYPALRRLHPVIVQVALGPHGTVERLQTGPFPTRAAAAAFCAKLKVDDPTCRVLPAHHTTENDTSRAGGTGTESAGLVATDP